MKDTQNIREAERLVADAKEQIAENMRDRGIGAIMWDLSRADFHYIPEIVEENDKVVRVTGLYVHDGYLYAIEEGTHGTSIREFYHPGEDVPPVVVTLTPDVARGDFGNPDRKQGFSRAGSDQEWLTIADCYFEALAED